MYNAVSLGIEGMNPAKTSGKWGCAKIISKINEKPMMATNAIINASIFRIPLLIKNRRRNVSKTVIITPSISEISNNKFKPIAIPKTSAKSQAAIAISAKKYKI